MILKARIPTGGKKYQMTEEIVLFKGSREGLYLIINKESQLDIIQNKIREKIDSAKSFFGEIKNVKLKETSLSKEDLFSLTKWLDESYGIKIDNNSEEFIKIERALDNQIIDQGMTKYIYSTLRSGGSIKFDGNIVIIGDVNPGAEVIATGNIIIMGTLRGIAHAGFSGNVEAMVVAFSLEPTQLRIANIIARSPDQQDFKPNYPEKACINENSIIILPYYQNL